MIKFLSKERESRIRGAALLRLDFNTEDDWRMVATLPTIKFLLRHGCKVVVVSHKGRPKGADKKLSLRKDAEDLQKFLKKKVKFIPHFDFPKIKKEVDLAPKKSVFLLENIRFLAGEEKDSLGLGRKLASLGDFYVNDAFPVSHRKSASVSAVTKFLPAYGGLRLEEEIKHLSSVMRGASKPLVVVLGGGKAADKLEVLEYFKNRADTFLLGGAPANTLFWLQGLDIGDSVADRNHRKFKKFLNYKKIALPVDCNLSGRRILDVGPATIKRYSEIIRPARTVIWNGPLGLIEKEPYHKGTLGVARAIAANRKCFSLAGGGETVMFLKKYKLSGRFSFISTGGGAMLQFLAGKKLPGIEALKSK